MAITIHTSGDTETARKRYNRAARFYDVQQAIGERLIFRRLRRQFWTKAPAATSILEVGVGTGGNIAQQHEDKEEPS